MKNNIKLLSCLLISLAFFACDDEINDLQPFTEGNPQTFFNSEATFQNGVDGIYSQFQNYYASTGSGMQGIPDILSDNVVLAASGRRSNEIYFDWRYVPSTGGAIPLYWSEGYEAINAANLVIGQIDNLADGAAKDNILGQALAARAFAHFDLVRTYGQIPTSGANAGSSMGVVYMKVEDGDTGDPLAQYARESVESNYSEIIGDLERAADLIGANNGEGRLDRDAVFGILSRVYLYNGEYQKVIDAANEVSEDIASMSELPGVYTDSNNAGVLVEWSVNTSSESGESNVGVLYSQSSLENGEIVNTISEYVIDFGFLQMIDPNDVRLDVLVFTGENQGNEYNAIKKFLGETGQVNGLLDIKVLRVAEVLLNKAEAQYRIGNESEALSTLNIVRDNRYTSYEGGESGEDLLDAILFNRRVELAFEGHRFFDIKRLGNSITRTDAGDLADGSGTPPDDLELEAGNFRFLFPIPQAEINANDNIEQNPGY